MAFDLGSAIGFLDLDTSGFKKGIRSAIQELDSFKDESASIGNKINAIGVASKGAGQTLTKYVTAPIVGAGGAMLYFGTQMEQGFRKFQNATGKSADEAKEYKKVMDNVFSSNWGESYEDVADAMALINQQMGDMPVEKMELVTKQALALRDTFDIDVNEGIRGANALIKNFGLEADQAYNLIIQGAQAGLNQNQDLADQLSEYSVYYKQLGFSAEEMFGILETGAKNGVFQIDYMNDAIKEFGIRVIDGSDTTAEGFAAIGMNANTMAQKFVQGGETAQEAFWDVIKALNEMDDEVARNQAGVALFGTKWEDLGNEAIPALAEMESSISSTNDAFSQLEEANMESLTRSLESLAASFGELMLPYAQAFVEKLTGIIDTIKNLPDPVKSFIIVVGSLVATIGPALLIFSSLITSFTTIKTAIMGVGTLLKAAPMVIGAVGKAITLAGGPVTIIMGLISALIIYLVNLWNTNEEFRTKVTEIWNSIKAMFSSVIQAIIGFFKGLVEDIAGVASSIKQKWEELVSWFKGKAQDFKQIGSDFVEGLKQGLVEKWEGLKTKAKGLVDGFKSIFTGKDGFDTHSPSKWAEKVAKNVDEGFAKGFDVEKSEAVQKAEQYSQGLMQAATKWVDDRKFYNELTIQEEIDFWKEMLKNGKLGADQKEEINKKLYTLDKELSEQILSEQEEFLENQKAAIEEYNSLISSRADSLKSFAGLFDSVVSDTEVTGKELLENLQGQVASFEQWQQNMNELQERGISGALLEELRELGPKSAKEIEALTELTDEELQKYQELFDQKLSLAEGQALIETGSFEQFILGKNSEEQLKGVGYTVATGVGEGFAEKSDEVFTDKVEQGTELVNEKIEDNKEVIYGAGKNMIGYLEDGIDDAYLTLQLLVEDIVTYLTNKLNDVIDLVERIKAQASQEGYSVDGSFRSGLSYVPYDGFVAELHEGERVLTKEENKEYSSGNKKTGGDTYNFYSPKAITPREARRQMKKAKRDILGGYT